MPKDASSRPALTPRQKEILKIIKKGAARGIPPTMREIGAGAGISANAVLQQLRVMETKGYIERDKRIARGIRVIA